MGPDALPKCLLKVGDRSLLQMNLDALWASGIRELALVVGYRRQEVEAEARARAGSLRLTILENPRYREGAILSLWTARAHLDGDVLIMDADVLYPPVFLEKLLRSPHRNCVLVDPSAPDTGEEQMVFGEGKRVLHIAKRPSPEQLARWRRFGESIGFLKLDRSAAQILRGLLEEKVDSGVVGIEHEQVYPDLFRQVPVGFETSEGLPWIEIDTPEDLRRAAEEILPRWAMPACLNRVISRRFLPWALRLPVTPNQWTGLSFLLGLGSLVMIQPGGYGEGLLAALLFQLFYIVDNWDGEVARARGLISRWGGWFDVGVDAVIQTALPLALAAGLRRWGAPAWVTGASWAAAIGIALSFGVTAFAKAKGFGPAVFGDPSRGEGAASDSRWGRWMKVNLTQENFSLLVAAALILDLRLVFLCATAVGAQVFWMGYLWKERRRLFYRQKVPGTF